MTHFIIAGFMGTGKSTVGRMIAERLGFPFFDCDTEIEIAAKKDIPRIFAEDGEKAFRLLETQTMTRLLDEDKPSVLALGGGALCTPGNLDIAKRSGPVICLTADPDAIYRRCAAQAGQRPLLQVDDPKRAICELLEKRQQFYSQANAQVDTTGLKPREVVDEILQWLNSVRVNLGERSYTLHIKEGYHALLGEQIAHLAPTVSSVVIISNPKIDGLYGEALRASLTGAKIPHHTLLVPAGERYKTLETAGRLFGRLIEKKVDRKALIIALGGGVIGDLSGFIAAAYQRGIRFVQVPTTLLAQVDSSVGGKVGVNHRLGKNMIGAFLQPKVVLIDPRVLKTLPRRELRSGMAEVIKHGMIWDQHYFEFLETHVKNIMRLEPQVIKHVVRVSCQIKAHVVEKDEKELNLRAILNFGHTAAHAVETYFNYKQYSHGEAVAIGMVVAARIANHFDMLDAVPMQRLIDLLGRFNLPTSLPELDPEAIINLMSTDKKVEVGKIRFVLPTRIGHVEIVSDVPRDILLRSIKETIE